MILRDIWRQLCKLPKWTPEIGKMRDTWDAEEAAAIELHHAMNSNKRGAIDPRKIADRHGVSRLGLIIGWHRCFDTPCPTEVPGDKGVRIAWEASINHLLGE